MLPNIATWTMRAVPINMTVTLHALGRTMPKEKWIAKAIKKPGVLRKSLGVSKKTGKIQVSKLKKAAKKGGKLGKRARLALVLRDLPRRKS